MASGRFCTLEVRVGQMKARRMTATATAAPAAAMTTRTQEVLGAREDALDMRRSFWSGPKKEFSFFIVNLVEALVKNERSFLFLVYAQSYRATSRRSSARNRYCS